MSCCPLRDCCRAQPVARSFAARVFTSFPCHFVCQLKAMVARPRVHNFRGRLSDLGVLFARERRLDGLSQSAIARLLNVSRSTVWRRLRGPLPSERPRRLRATTPAVLRRRQRVRELLAMRLVLTPPPAVRAAGQRGRLRISRVRVVQPHNSPRKIALQLQQEGIPCCKSTVQRDLHLMGLQARRRPRGPTFFVGDTAKRMVFARAMLRLMAANGELRVLFSDEKYCSSNDEGSGWQWCAQGERAAVRGYEKWAAKVHVWGVVGIGVKVLVILPHDERVTADMYVNQCLKPNLRVIKGDNKLFMQDGAAAHTARVTVRYLKRSKVAMVPDWPARSPDLNPIERVWAVLSKKLEGSGATTVGEMRTAVSAAWDGIPQRTIDQIVGSFRPKLQECVRFGGELVRR